MTFASSVSFEKYLLNTKSKVANCLKAHLKTQKAILDETDPHVTSAIIDALIDFSTRGKMFRAALLGLGFEIVNPRPHSQLPILIQAGFELIQTGLLIQDDIVDGDDMRRGVPTIHKLLEMKCHEWNPEVSKTDAETNGKGLAMVASDLAIVLAYDTFLDCKFPSDAIIKATAQLNRNLIKTAIGQAMDVSLHDPRYQDSDSILKASLYKTAYYTVVGPMQLGATLAGANTKLIDNIESFGRNVGLAYQIRDDILDIFEDNPDDESRLMSDIVGNKPTVLIGNTLAMTSGRDYDSFVNTLGNRDPANLSLNTIRDIMVGSGAVSTTTEQAQDFAAKGENLIPFLTKNPNLAELLRGVCLYAVNREG